MKTNNTHIEGLKTITDKTQPLKRQWGTDYSNKLEHRLEQLQRRFNILQKEHLDNLELAGQIEDQRNDLRKRCERLLAILRCITLAADDSDVECGYPQVEAAIDQARAAIAAEQEGK